MIRLDRRRTAAGLLPAINRMFEFSAVKIRSLEATWRPEDGAPVFTVEGVYKSRGWTEWTQGFQFGASLLQFDATGEREFLELGRSRTLERMAPHLTHVGVHDHGFNNVSTYGNLWRLAREGRFDAAPWELGFYALALKVTGAVQARRWTKIPDGGFIYSFNGAHSLFVDTIRTLRALALSHALGHCLCEEQDVKVNLLERLLHHARATAEYSVYYGTSRDTYDVRGRTAHESLFNAANGTYRGPSSQQGYSPFSTWTRGLAWAMLGFAEQLEFLETVQDEVVCLSAAARSMPTSFGETRPGVGEGGNEKEGLTPFMTQRWRRAISTSITPLQRMAFRTGTPERRDWRRSVIGARGPLIRSTITSRLTALLLRSPRRACCGSRTLWRAAVATAANTSRRGCARLRR